MPTWEGVEVSWLRYQRLKARFYYYTHRKQMNASSSKYHAENRDKINARRREASRIPARMEKEKARTKRYMQTHPWMASYFRAKRTSRERSIVFDLKPRDCQTLWTMARREYPSERLSIYRKDKKGPYSVQNCAFKPRRGLMAEYAVINAPARMAGRWPQSEAVRAMQPQAPVVGVVKAAECEECGLTGEHQRGCSEWKA